MPIITDKKQIGLHRESQKTCHNCKEPPGRSDRSSINICDICSNWFCKDCTEIEDKVYDFVIKNDIVYSYICSLCKTELPRIKDIVNIRQKQSQLIEDLASLKKEVEKNTKAIRDYESLKERLSTVEKVIKTNKLDDEQFPSLPDIDATTKKLQLDLYSQVATTDKINTDMKEEKQKATRSKNLIVYGLPETPNVQIKELMMSDFKKIKDLYEGRVDINPNDITAITRLGNKKENKIRPIRLTFIDDQCRKEILTNNKGLLIEGNEYDECECRAGGKHIHVNITNDKTKQERELENELREELKNRRTNGEDVIIKKGKIVLRRPVETHTRWVDIYQNGL